MSWLWPTALTSTIPGPLWMSLLPAYPDSQKKKEMGLTRWNNVRNAAYTYGYYFSIGGFFSTFLFLQQDRLHGFSLFEIRVGWIQIEVMWRKKGSEPRIVHLNLDRYQKKQQYKIIFQCLLRMSIVFSSVIPWNRLSIQLPFWLSFYSSQIWLRPSWLTWDWSVSCHRRRPSKAIPVQQPFLFRPQDLPGPFCC